MKRTGGKKTKAVNSKVSIAAKENPGRKKFLIVAIGASAGGLEAMTQLLKYLAPDTGMAFVYVQHLDPTHPSMLVPLLSKSTKMKVLEAANKATVQPNHVYVIPPGKELFALDGILTLTPRKKNGKVRHMPIDNFFISLAQEEKERAVGIILSGTANDGTAGLKAIKIAGGLTMVQNDTAKFQSMPRSAVSEGVVDLVLSPKDMAVQLENLSKNSTLYYIDKEAPDNEKVEDNDADLTEIIALLKRNIGVDFGQYKINTIKRRIIRRMLLNRIDNLKTYGRLLLKSPDEAGVLYNDLLINVTNFFRDTETMDYLGNILLPKIINGKTVPEPLRIWVPACATGEEAYTIAMLVAECLSTKTQKKRVQIFATDLSESAIAKARLGLYTKNDVADVSPARLQRFFTKTDGNYRVNKSIRDMCIFAPHDITHDPPFSRIDLISCCNLFIYMEALLQRKIIGIFHYALVENGHLVLGKSESIGGATHLFGAIDKKLKIYIRKKSAVSLSRFDIPQLPGTKAAKESIEPEKPNQAAEPGDFSKIADEILLSHYTPPGIIVNSSLDILQFRGSIGLFLEPSPGRASLNLIKMARPGLGFELRNAIHKATKTGKPVKKENIEINNNGIVRSVAIEVIPFKAEANERHFLVLLGEKASDVSITASKDVVVKRLEKELVTVREDMRNIVEHGEAAYEELQSANEEIISSNEELQSINEELETSKEELESTNEELVTVNDELQTINRQLTETQDYNDAIYTTVRDAVLVLDSALCVKSANKAFYEKFKLTEKEIEGKYLFEIAGGQWDSPRLRQLMQDMLPKNSVCRDFELVHTFAGMGEKTLLLNARRLDMKIHGGEMILLAIEDITELKRMAKSDAQREWYRNMADNAPVMIWLTGKDKSPIFFNDTWLSYTGHTFDEELADGGLKSIHADDRDNYLKIFNQAFNKRVLFKAEYRLRRNDGEYRWMLVTGKPGFSIEGDFTGYIGSTTEIHDRKLMLEELEKQVNERTIELKETNINLNRSNEELQQFAYAASHDLQEPLRKVTTFIGMLNSHYAANLPDDAKALMERVLSASARMSKLIEELLNFSRSTQPTKLVKTDLNEIIKEVVKNFDLIVQEKDAEIMIDEPLPVIKAMPLQMKQLFHNLLGNALKFTRPETRPVIHISNRPLTKDEIEKYTELNDEKEYIDITVSDNGMGFRPEFAQQIFIIFQRLHGQSEYPGTGIGLALCRKIVENHKGLIFAAADENKGAEFHVILPAG